ncbi:hypothetical protein KK083_12200 [Fulvivirgaceae bacterium PWU4]|uniref:Uncharacterized protein n=1 Tax=Chryseosolibacter histidini TaxID=2782349 RepID=A0AAP2GJ46_9BACT|nr:hypothetical protein [Chryseosolibacter histidini]MBT1697644.1 hypothetical protein [Chryseosolibacter histidini]
MKSTQSIWQDQTAPGNMKTAIVMGTSHVHSQTPRVRPCASTGVGMLVKNTNMGCEHGLRVQVERRYEDAVGNQIPAA